jgi:hypothetical protein
MQHKEGCKKKLVEWLAGGTALAPQNDFDFEFVFFWGGLPFRV